MPVRTVRAVAAQLLDAGILATRVEKGHHQDSFQLGRPAESIAVTDVLDALRGRRPDGDRGDLVAAVLGDLDGAAQKAAAERTLADLLDAPGRAATESTV